MSIKIIFLWNVVDIIKFHICCVMIIHKLCWCCLILPIPSGSYVNIKHFGICPNIMLWLFVVKIQENLFRMSWPLCVVDFSFQVRSNSNQNKITFCFPQATKQLFCHIWYLENMNIYIIVKQLSL